MRVGVSNAKIIYVHTVTTYLLTTVFSYYYRLPYFHEIKKKSLSIVIFFSSFLRLVQAIEKNYNIHYYEIGKNNHPIPVSLDSFRRYH